MRKYFYIGKRLALELNGGQARSILYGMECVLSELDKNELSTSAMLLAANRENSVLKANLTRSYSAYGFDDLTSRESLIGFNGEARNNVVGCDLLGNGRRAYSPVLMRFLSPDIMSPFEGGGLNAYMYCEGDPINYSDPSAMCKLANKPRPSPPMVQTVNKSNAIKKNKLPRKSRTAASGERRPDAPAVSKKFWEAMNDLVTVNVKETPRSAAIYIVDNYRKGRVNQYRGPSVVKLLAAIEHKIITRGRGFTRAFGWEFDESLSYSSANSERGALRLAVNRAVAALRRTEV